MPAHRPEATKVRRRRGFTSLLSWPWVAGIYASRLSRSRKGRSARDLRHSGFSRASARSERLTLFTPSGLLRSLMPTDPERRVGARIAIGAVVLGGLFLPGAAPLLAQTYLGPSKCVGCHDHERQARKWQKEEPAAFKGKAHYNTLKQLDAPKSAQWAKAVGLADPYDVKGSCVKCHATVFRGDANAGVSCESCHGPSSKYNDLHQQKGSLRAVRGGGPRGPQGEAARPSPRSASSATSCADKRWPRPGTPRAPTSTPGASLQKLVHWDTTYNYAAVTAAAKAAMGGRAAPAGRRRARRGRAGARCQGARRPPRRRLKAAPPPAAAAGARRPASRRPRRAGRRRAAPRGRRPPPRPPARTLGLGPAGAPAARRLRARAGRPRRAANAAGRRAASRPRALRRRGAAGARRGRRPWCRRRSPKRRPLPDGLPGRARGDRPSAPAVERRQRPPRPRALRRPKRSRCAARPCGCSRSCCARARAPRTRPRPAQARGILRARRRAAAPAGRGHGPRPRGPEAAGMSAPERAQRCCERYERRLQLMVPAELEFLKPLPLFSGIPEKAREKVIEKVRKYLHVVTYQPGEIVLRQGEYGDSAFYIVNGAAEVLLQARTRRQRQPAPQVQGGRPRAARAAPGRAPGPARRCWAAAAAPGHGHPLRVPRASSLPAAARILEKGEHVRRDVGALALSHLGHRARGDAARACCRSACPACACCRPPRRSSGPFLDTPLPRAHPRAAPAERRAVRRGRRRLHRAGCKEEGRAARPSSPGRSSPRRARPPTPSSWCGAAT